jgi:hypothetical protein
MIELITTPTKMIAVDIVGTFGLTLQAEQTKYSVEDGSVRVDHKILSPKTLEIEIKQTETPIEDPDFEFEELEFEVRKVATRVLSVTLLAGQAVGAVVSSAVDLLGGVVDAKKMQTFQTQNPRDRGGALEDELTELWASDEVASVTYKGRTRDNMSLIGVAVVSDRPVGLTTFQCSFEEKQTAVIETVLLPNPRDLVNVQKKSLGKKKGKDEKISEDKANKITSVLRRLTS